MFWEGGRPGKRDCDWRSVEEEVKNFFEVAQGNGRSFKMKILQATDRTVYVVFFGGGGGGWEDS